MNYLRSAVLQYENRLIAEALLRHNGNITQTSMDLGIQRTVLQRKIKRDIDLSRLMASLRRRY